MDLLTEQDDVKFCCAALALESQCIPSQAADAKELREKLSSLEKIELSEKNTTKHREQRRGNAAGKRVATLQTELVEAKAANARSVDISARSEADAVKARAGLRICKVLLGKGEQASKLASTSVNNARKQFVDLAKATEKTSSQPMERLSQAMLLEGKVSFLKTEK